ncbi:Response regulator [hydrothermal vent metagenome]|uniref:Response regulator n=1 Tax=hydrothermal vent metagenome TaxID=652676 RepID=A0A3B1DMV1_9ZZZZ
MNPLNQTPTASPDAPTFSNARSHTILIVDDSEANRMVLEGQVITLGHTPVLAENGLVALKKVTDIQPDLLLLDIMMPKMDGYQVLARLKSDSTMCHIPVIMVSANDEIESVVKCIEQGAIDYLVKPFSPVLLKARIKAALANKLLHDQEEAYRETIRKYNEKLEERVRERTKDLEETRLEVIQRLGRAAEYRDNETGQHVLRMSHYSARMAKELGVNDEGCHLLLLTSPMHDIGKIGIPDGILLKPGPLTDDERKIMETHSNIGGEILGGGKSELIKMAETIALTHQEKWDGTGYPKGLKGKEIPLVGQITAICDVFDAITSKRPYKEASSIEEALEYITIQSGKHFNPHLVKIFLKIVPDLKKIKEKFSQEKNPRATCLF